MLKITAAHDVGRAINPTLVEGQIEGGVAQGLGDVEPGGLAVLDERRARDERKDHEGDHQQRLVGQERQGANGVVGVKPTFGAISQRGIIPVARSQDTAGPLARSVADAALLLGVLMGSPDGRSA